MKITFPQLLLFLCLVLPAQAQNRLNEVFRSSSVWMLEDYYNGLMQGKMPLSLHPRDNQTLAVEFKNKSRELKLLGFHGCMTYKYDLLKRNVIKVLDNLGRTVCTMELRKMNGMDKIIVSSKGKERTFLCIPEKYTQIEGVFHFINDCYIAGSYIIPENKNSRVTFTSDGKIKGYMNYNEYSIALTGDAVPKEMNILVMQEIKNLGNGGRKITRIDYFSWEKKDGKIFLYRLSEPTPDGKIEGKPMELVRTGS